jgi:hypothetical protein
MAPGRHLIAVSEGQQIIFTPELAHDQQAERLASSRYRDRRYARNDDFAGNSVLAGQTGLPGTFSNIES